MKLAHVGLCSLDTKALAAWYERVLGMTVASENDKVPPTIFLHDEGGALIEVYPAAEAGLSSDNRRQGLRHLAFATDDIEAARDRLLREEVEIVDDLKTHPNGARTLFFRDTEGNILHFLQR